MNRLSLPRSETSIRATTRRRVSQLQAAYDKLVVAADLIGVTSDPCHGSLFGDACHCREEDVVAGQAEDVADPVALAPAHRFRPAIVAVAAHQDVDPWPARADGANDVP